MLIYISASGIMTKQTAGDQAVLVTAGGSVTITNGLSLSETKEMFRLMLRENLVGIQDEAYRIAEQRNEKLLSDFLEVAESRFEGKVEEKLAGFKDPGAQFALRHAQSEYCKYGSEEGGADSIELLISRLDEGGKFEESVVIDEAIKLCGRLSKNQMDLTCLIHMTFRSTFSGIASDASFREFLDAAFKYSGGISCRNSEIAMLANAGVIQQFTQTRHWLPLSQVLKNNYPGLLMQGAQPEYFGLPADLQPRCLSRHIRHPDLTQPNHVSLIQWERGLSQLGMSADDARDARTKAESNLLSDEEVRNLVQAYIPGFEELFSALDRNEGEPHEIRNYDLTPVGRALALARTRRDGWRPELTLAPFL